MVVINELAISRHLEETSDTKTLANDTKNDDANLFNKSLPALTTIK
ncbi:Uncharacterised protein [Chlamydia trachomatis]|nr:Uncharacterised protein [Chlamydia trachomatis]